MRLLPTRGVWLALAVTAVGVGLLFLASTWGVSAWSRAQTSGEGGAPVIPATVENAPPNVGTTGQLGPVGSVSIVYAGTHVEDGLVGRIHQPWLAIGARSGVYRAIDAPGLPAPREGGVAVSPDGRTLVWATGEGLVVYDAPTDASRRLPLAGASRVGHVSPDGSMVSVQADGLQLVDLDSGEVRGEVSGTAEDAAEASAWRADSTAVDVVVGEELLTVAADGQEPARQPSPFREGASLAWSPGGDRLVARQQEGDLVALASAEPRSDGSLGTARSVDTEGLSVGRLLGFSGEETVAVSAYLLESGAVERVLDVPLDGGSPVNVSTLPSPGENWVGTGTLAVSADSLRSGSTDFGNPPWPWSHRSRLAACLLIGVFGLGLWLTRRPRAERRRRRTAARTGTG